MGAKIQFQRISSNIRLFLIIFISILLIAVITGLGVYFWQKSASEKVIDSLGQEISSLEEQISTCHEYTIYPFPNKPSAPRKSDVGIYIHAPKEPIGCGASIGYKLQRYSDTFTIELGKTSYSTVCPQSVGPGSGHTPNARILLGKLNIGTYNVLVKTCGYTDKYLLQIESNRYVIQPLDVQSGKIHPDNKGIYDF